jgi:uncharacterized protein (TIGR01777 family)
VTGGRGLIGSALRRYLRERGRDAVALTREKPNQADELRWDASAPEPRMFEGAEAVVHLAGATIAGRWTAHKRDEIRHSRVESTQRLVAALASCMRPPRALIVMSAVGYYGDRGDETLEESSLPGSGFLASVVRDWEAAAAEGEACGMRVIRVRAGLVLSAAGGALAAMLPAFRLGLGGALGRGDQWWSWIALPDVVAVLERSLDDEAISGPINAVAPEAVTAREFARTLGRVLSRPARFDVPAALLRLALGDMADELLLASQRVTPGRLIERRFEFAWPKLEAALRHELAS